MGWFSSPEKKAVVTAQIFAGDGGRLSDPSAVEDRQVNALISHSQKMAFPLRRPVRVFRHMRNGLKPMKVRSRHVITRSPRDPGMDLEFLLQLEGGWYAAYSGEGEAEDGEAKRLVWLRYLAVGGGVLAFLLALALRYAAGDPPPAETTQTAEAAAGLLAGGFNVLAG